MAGNGRRGSCLLEKYQFNENKATFPANISSFVIGCKLGKLWYCNIMQILYFYIHCPV